MIHLPPFDIPNAGQAPVYDYTITLSELEYRVVLVYRERGDRWYLSLYDADGLELLVGKKLSVDVPLLENYQIAGLPPGELALWDTANSDTECGFDDLGVRCLLIYIEPDELVDPREADDITIEAAP